MPHPKPGRGLTGQQTPPEARQDVGTAERVQRPIARPRKRPEPSGGLRYPDAAVIEMIYYEQTGWAGNLSIPHAGTRKVLTAAAKSYRTLGDQLARKYKKWLAEQNKTG